MNIAEQRGKIKTFEHGLDTTDFEAVNYSKYKLIPIELLIPADWNYKTNDEFLSEKLRNNIRRNGQIENIHVRELDTGFYEVINGNHRLPELVALDRKFVLCYDHGKISLEEAQRITIETNETRFESDQEKLASILRTLSEHFEDDEIAETLPFNQEELQDLLDSLDEVSLDTIEEDDYEGEVPEQPKTARGDLIEMNNHRILCGDSTKPEDVTLLMDGKKANLLFTDPPYNVNYAEFNVSGRNTGTGKDWSNLYCNEWDDDYTDDEYFEFLVAFLKNAKENLTDYAHYYVFFAFEFYEMLIKAFKANDIKYDKVPIIWVKQVAPPSWARYGRKYEPCIFAGKDAATGTKSWNGPTNETNVWNINRDHNGSYIHPTQKPVELAARGIKNSTRPGDIVLELFCGSASTLIAADQLGRKCYAMEYEPGFVDVEVDRYIKYCQKHEKECVIKKNGVVIDNNEYLRNE